MQENEEAKQLHDKEKMEISLHNFVTEQGLRRNSNNTIRTTSLTTGKIKSAPKNTNNILGICQMVKY
jgi:hypothetical protein